MDGDHHGSLQVGRRFRRVVRIHGEVAADGDDGVMEGVQVLQQLHIAEQAGISRKVEGGAVEINDETAGMAAGDTASVEGQSHTHFAEGELVGAAQVHGVGAAACLSGGSGDLSGGDDQGVALFRQFEGAAQMVVMEVGDEDVVHLQVLALDVAGIAVQERVADQGLPACGHGEACMMDIAEFS